jgi:hypothetical protein
LNTCGSDDLQIRRTDSNISAVVVLAGFVGGQTIDGAATKILDVDRHIHLVSQNGVWISSALSAVPVVTTYSFCVTSSFAGGALKTGITLQFSGSGGTVISGAVIPGAFYFRTGRRGRLVQLYFAVQGAQVTSTAGDVLTATVWYAAGSDPSTTAPTLASTALSTSVTYPTLAAVADYRTSANVSSASSLRVLGGDYLALVVSTTSATLALGNANLIASFSLF